MNTVRSRSDYRQDFTFAPRPVAAPVARPRWNAWPMLKTLAIVAAVVSVLSYL